MPLWPLRGAGEIMKTKRIGFIGSGSRAANYATHLKMLKEIDVDYPAICDTNPEFRGLFNEFYAGGRAREYSDYRRMLANHPDLDGVVICTPNDQHEDIAVACLAADSHILLEKPLASTPESCLNILKAARSCGKNVTLGFVLRYTPFYRKIKEIVDSGMCGEILTVSAEEIVNLYVTRLLVGGWRRKQARSGNALLEKCCHDLDIFNWILGRMPVRVHSFGSMKAFARIDGAGPRCRDCQISAECPYYFNVNDFSVEAQRAHEWGFLVTWTDTCVYDGEVDVCDHQVVSLDYGDGTILNLTMTFGSEINTRTIRIIGTRGRVEGDISAREVRIGTLLPLKQDSFAIEDDGTCHNGGDGEICRSFERSLLDPDYIPSATVEDGFRSAMVAFAAERSRVERRVVELAELYTELGLGAGEINQLRSE